MRAEEEGVLQCTTLRFPPPFSPDSSAASLLFWRASPSSAESGPPPGEGRTENERDAAPCVCRLRAPIRPEERSSDITRVRTPEPPKRLSCPRRVPRGVPTPEERRDSGREAQGDSGAEDEDVAGRSGPPPADRLDLWRTLTETKRPPAWREAREGATLVRGADRGSSAPPSSPESPGRCWLLASFIVVGEEKNAGRGSPGDGVNGEVDRGLQKQGSRRTCWQPGDSPRVQAKDILDGFVSRRRERR
ncbi:UNVERIFIED_CONTAM: hypothetical protein HHA_462060 [Hammondia hammondi]|eukprot:XP_008883985.1 hypothetical protein HHA_462060 [Hammondia hammondi]